MLLRDRQDEAIGIIRRLFNGERVTATSDWFTLQDAALQLLPLQEDMPCAVASQISPSGMTLAGKHGIGVISIGSLSEEGLNALPTQWSFAEAAAAQHGQTVDRKHWRVLLSWHIAETRDKARAEARDGLLRHHNEYITGTLQRPGARPFTTPDEAVDKTAFAPGAAATIGTPDDLVERIKSVLDISGGFGTVVGFVHDWANPENTAQLGHGGALRGAGDQRLSRRFAAVARLRRQQPRVFQPRPRGRDGEDHRERGRGRGARGHEVAAAGRLVRAMCPTWTRPPPASRRGDGLRFMG